MKKLLLACAFALMSFPALAGSISVQVAETGQTTLTKTYTVADADIDKIVAAYQSGANVSINGTATRAQVLLYWVQTTLVAPTITAVQAAQTSAPVIPPPITVQ